MQGRRSPGEARRKYQKQGRGAASNTRHIFDAASATSSCRLRSCRPLTFIFPRCNLYSFLQEFDAAGSAMRRSSDCVDVQIMRQWAVAAQQSYGMRTAMMGLIVATHFKSVRTWGVINTTFKQHIDWVQLRLLLARCGVLWGKNGSHAIHIVLRT